MKKIAKEGTAHEAQEEREIGAAHLDAMMAVTGTKSLAALAVVLGVTRSAVHSWSARGKVPARRLLEFASAYGMPIGWVSSGEISEGDLADAVLGKSRKRGDYNA